jgi:hypothetical protein
MSMLGLVALGLAAIFALVVLVAFPPVRAAISQMLTGTFILFLGLTLVALLVIAITGINLDPSIRQVAVALTRHRLVDFYTLLPKQDRVQDVQYVETDGDPQKEWVVFYQFDLADGRSPYAGAVYDYDRGDPPVLFPYRLVPPDRDYLSEGVVRLDLEDIVTLGEVQPMPELLVYGEINAPKEAGGKIATDLTIFRYIPNSLPWEFPRDEPRAYQVIGNFRGDGGITFDPKTKTVTVLNRAGYDRSQLAVETVYTLDEARGTYMSLANPEQLGAPVSSRVVFAFGMPSDILDTPYPEKLVLGFYESLAQKPPVVEPREFLTGQALIEYDRGNLAYFGFGTVTGKVSQVSITQLSYAPEVEQIDPSITVLGEEPRFLIVSVDFEAQVGASFTQTTQPIQWVTTMVNGKWKIDRRL